MRVLLVEDEAELRDSLTRRLRASGIAVDEAPDLGEAQAAVGVNEYDCLVLDRMLPGGDALELVTALRGRGHSVPALFLTARDTVDDRVAGFEAGGDDYLVKPFAVEELIARVHSLCRRSATARPARVCIEDLELDAARREVRRGGVLLPLTAKELAILELLAASPGAVVTRTRIIEHCWDEHTDPLSNVVEVHMASLRRKLGAPDLIRTVRGEGYLLDAPAA
ncbi:MAG: response regulator transcription factor [Actinomycetota bacterium]